MRYDTMQLTLHQRDNLTELFNVAVGRAAASLAGLAGQRVHMTVPTVELCPAASIGQVPGAMSAGELAIVQLVFTGPVGGHALLLFTTGDALRLSMQVEQRHSEALVQAVLDVDVLTELGNIVLHVALGIVAELLKTHLIFSAPRFHTHELAPYLASLLGPAPTPHYALVVLTGLQLAELDVTGRLVMIVSVHALDRLLQALERWPDSYRV